jgi:hypothetical protein
VSPHLGCAPKKATEVTGKLQFSCSGENGKSQLMQSQDFKCVKFKFVILLFFGVRYGNLKSPFIAPFHQGQLRRQGEGQSHGGLFTSGVGVRVQAHAQINGGYFFWLEEPVEQV